MVLEGSKEKEKTREKTAKNLGLELTTDDPW